MAVRFGGSAVDHLRQELELQADDVVQVTLDHPANVQLLDPSNYLAYQQGKHYRYHGGYVTQRSFRIKAPQAGKWFLVVDLGGGAGSVRASVAVLSGAASS
jgi:hypothetical protein